MTLFQGLFRRTPKDAGDKKDKKGMQPAPALEPERPSVVGNALDELATEDEPVQEEPSIITGNPLDDFTEMDGIEDLLARVELEAGAEAAGETRRRSRPRPEPRAEPEPGPKIVKESMPDFNQLLGKLEAIESKMDKSKERPVVIAAPVPQKIVQKDEYPRHEFEQLMRKIDDMDSRISKVSTIIELEGMIRSQQSEGRQPEIPEPLLEKINEIESKLSKVDFDRPAQRQPEIPDSLLNKIAEIESKLTRADMDRSSQRQPEIPDAVLNKMAEIESKLNKVDQERSVHRQPEIPESVLSKITEMESRLNKVDQIHTSIKQPEIPESLLSKMGDMESRLNSIDQDRASRKEDYDRFEKHILRIEQALSKPAEPQAQVTITSPAPVQAPIPAFSPGTAQQTAKDDIPQFIKPSVKIEEFKVPGKASKDEPVLSAFVPGAKAAGSAPTGKLHEVSLAELDADFGPFVPGQKAQARPRPPAPRAQPKSKPFELSLPPYREMKRPLWAPGGTPILTSISKDYLTMVLVMRWIEFLFERVTRKNFITVLDYYRETGWITEEVEKEIISLARGEMQDVNKIMAREEEAVTEEIEESGIEQTYSYKKVDDWRLSADDHLKSLLFVMKIAGYEIDRDRLNSLEHMIEKFTENLENFHAV